MAPMNADLILAILKTGQPQLVPSNLRTSAKSAVHPQSARNIT